MALSSTPRGDDNQAALEVQPNPGEALEFTRIRNRVENLAREAGYTIVVDARRERIVITETPKGVHKDSPAYTTFWKAIDALVFLGSYNVHCIDFLDPGRNNLSTPIGKTE